MSEEKEVYEVEDSVEIELTDEQIDAILSELDGEESIDDVEDVLFNNRNIYLNGNIDEDAVNQVVPMIHYYNIQDEKNEVEVDDRQPINVYLNSPGGEIYNGNYIKNAMLKSKTPVHTIAQGTVGMSMGLILFLAGSHRVFSEDSFLLYHVLRAASDTETLNEMQNKLRHYEALQDRLDDFVLSRTSVPKEFLKQKRDSNLDWYISYDEAKMYNMFHKSI